MTDALRHFAGNNVVLAPIDTLHVWDMNPRDHDEEDVQSLANSIQEFGWTEPIIAQAETRRVIAGHGRLMAAQRLGLAEVPVMYVAMDEMQADAYAVADNQLATLSKWNPPKLKAVLQELKAHDPAHLVNLGFSPDELRALLDASAEFLREYEAQPTTEDPGRVEAANRQEMITLTVPMTEAQHATVLQTIRKAKQDATLTVSGEALAFICAAYLGRSEAA